MFAKVIKSLKSSELRVRAVLANSQVPRCFDLFNFLDLVFASDIFFYTKFF